LFLREKVIKILITKKLNYSKLVPYDIVDKNNNGIYC